MKQYYRQKSNRVGKISIRAIKAPLITVKNNLESIIKSLIIRSQLRERDILVITSKVLAVTQNRVKKFHNEKEFKQIVKSEADKVIGGEKVTLTLKDGIFTAWAGVDRSNAPVSLAVLWPIRPYHAAAELQGWLCRKYKLQKIGVIISDSFCLPLRKGVSAIAIGYAGFEGISDFRRESDLHGRKLQFTRQAIADNLSAAASIVMGEAAESTPFAIIRNAPVVFSSKKINPKSLIMTKKECLYAPLYEMTNYQAPNSK